MARAAFSWACTACTEPACGTAGAGCALWPKIRKQDGAQGLHTDLTGRFFGYCNFDAGWPAAFPYNSFGQTKKPPVKPPENRRYAQTAKGPIAGLVWEERRKSMATRPQQPLNGSNLLAVRTRISIRLFLILLCIRPYPLGSLSLQLFLPSLAEPWILSSLRVQYYQRAYVRRSLRGRVYNQFMACLQTRSVSLFCFGASPGRRKLFFL